MRGLIVGQGLAGSVLAWTLQKRGMEVYLADAGFPNRSSSIAAGIVNPVTGKRYVKSWRFDDFFPLAKAVYQAMEQSWGVPIWHDQHILRLLSTPQELNDWSVRMAAPEYAHFLGERRDSGPWSAFLAEGYAIGEIKHAARVSFPVLLDKVRETSLSQGNFLSGQMDYAEIEGQAKNYDFIIFCEGHHGINNPFFPNLKWLLAKGGALLLRMQHPGAEKLQEIVKKTVLLAPLGNGVFWAGASNKWTFEDSGPTADEQGFLEERLKKMLKVRYEVIKRMGAVRPTVKDRRPFLGSSLSHPNIFIFNGLGTKGALLAPFWAAHLADHLLEGETLDKAVDIKRFEP